MQPKFECGKHINHPVNSHYILHIVTRKLASHWEKVKGNRMFETFSPETPQIILLTMKAKATGQKRNQGRPIPFLH